MKRGSGRSRLFPLSLLLLLLFVVQIAGAAEIDPKSEAGAELSGAKLAPPATEKPVEEKKTGKEEAGGAAKEEGELKETLSKKKEEILVEPKPEEVVKANEGNLNGVSHVEECDPSNRCEDVKSKFVACLRVPGKDSLDLSLLIQNKGKRSLNVTITAPDYVTLEENTVQLKAKENREVKVSIKDSGNSSVIVLKAGGGSCDLNFQNIVSDLFEKSETAATTGYFSRPSTRSLIFIVVAATVLLSLAGSYMRFRTMRNQGGLKFQPLDAGLPVSTGGKKDGSGVDGWDNSWGNDWDDEEAPVTPSKPALTPSSKGLASRKLNKDSWKD